jgi:hypothetical protein
VGRGGEGRVVIDPLTLVGLLTVTNARVHTHAHVSFPERVLNAPQPSLSVCRCARRINRQSYRQIIEKVGWSTPPNESRD